jgi:hypothetical protein
MPHLFRCQFAIQQLQGYRLPQQSISSQEYVSHATPSNALIEEIALAIVNGSTNPSMEGLREIHLFVSIECRQYSQRLLVSDTLNTLIIPKWMSIDRSKTLIKSLSSAQLSVGYEKRIPRNNNLLRRSGSTAEEKTTLKTPTIISMICCNP